MNKRHPNRLRILTSLFLILIYIGWCFMGSYFFNHISIVELSKLAESGKAPESFMLLLISTFYVIGKIAHTLWQINPAVLCAFWLICIASIVMLVRYMLLPDAGFKER